MTHAILCPACKGSGWKHAYVGSTVCVICPGSGLSHRPGNVEGIHIEVPGYSRNRRYALHNDGTAVEVGGGSMHEVPYVGPRGIGHDYGVWFDEAGVLTVTQGQQVVGEDGRYTFLPARGETFTIRRLTTQK